MSHSTPQTVVQASAQRVCDLFHQGRFTVPWHQRYYDWEQRNVSALLNDIQGAISDNRKCYFLGTVMLVPQARSCWEINDGQQRMITLSLICAALCKRFHSEMVESQREGFALHILFDLPSNSPATLANAEKYTPRITPPKNDRVRYQQLIRGNSIGSNGKLTKAWRTIEDHFSAKTLEDVQEYFDYICDKIEIVCLSIPPIVDTNAVYEAINCRGKKLVDLDLIRNYLYSHFNVSDEEQRKSIVHSNLERIRTVIAEQTKAFEFVRCYFQCSFGFLPKENFYQYTRTRIEAEKNVIHQETPGNASRINSHEREYIFKLTGDLASGKCLELFRKIRTPSQDDDFAAQFIRDSQSANSRRNLTVLLFELSVYRVSHPLVFAMLRIYVNETERRRKKEIAKSVQKNLRRLAAFVLRTAFVAPKFETSQFEKEFATFAEHIVQAADPCEDEFFRFLRSCDRKAYQALNDTRLKSAIRELHLKGVSRIKQFLLGINENMDKDGYLMRGRSCSIEHVLPRSPVHWNGWKAFSNENLESCSTRIGNLTLMTRVSNSPTVRFNQSFQSKIPSFQTSAFQITRSLAEFDEWSPMAISQREDEMLRRAVQVWRFQ